MSNARNSIRILAARFVNLPPRIRVEVGARLLRLQDEKEASKVVQPRRDISSRAKQKSLLEQFWDEVEAAHGDGLHRTNPFAEESPLAT